MMNCTNCGKEIPDGETLCEDCKKKFNEEAEKLKEETKEEIKEEIKKENKKEKKEKKEKNKKENRETNEKKKDDAKFKIKDENKKVSKKELIVLFIILLVVILIFVVVNSILSKTNDTGNTFGNLRNYGYATTDGKYIYYLAPDEEFVNMGIYKANMDGSNSTCLYEAYGINFMDINIHDNTVYFITVADDEYTDEDQYDNKVCCVDTNGENYKILIDNKLNNESGMYVVKDYIYFIDEAGNVVRSDLNGNNFETILSYGTGFLGVTDKYIIFNYSVDTEEGYVTYICDLNGNNQSPIIEGQRLYNVDCDNKYVYYLKNNPTTDDENEDTSEQLVSKDQLARTKIGSGVEEILLDSAPYYLNYSNGYLYYLNYKYDEKINENGETDSTVSLYRIKANGTEKEATKIHDFDYGQQDFLIIVDKWVYFMGFSDSNTTISLLDLTTDLETEEENIVDLYKLNVSELLQKAKEESTSSSVE